ncbi:hypothetical protein FRB94_007538 [Tulasnella sp. JGI-2019a]|nr:hypothetical protein FRB94_007538 [Tulasnella sp. JGI-2019a]KAG9016086.1 hypothetical protein FRB93_011560 [Tulasnella sp. JGI-2019a]KAG9028884.1 hypothetical protein FRB95_005934 [Tulasnella sp. JGI-2019a]
MSTQVVEEQPKKIITYAELQAHKDKDDLYVLIHGKIYAATKFLDEHPGGDEVILAEAGKDATEAFEDVGHSDEAREVLNGLYVGDFDGADAKPVKPTTNVTTGGIQEGSSSNPITYLVPIAFLGAFLAWRFYLAP